MVNMLVLDGGVQYMLRRRTEVSAMKIPEDRRRPDELRLVCAVTSVDSLLALEQEET